MTGKHLVGHVGVMVVAIGVLTLLNVPFTSALLIGLLVGCMLMMLTMGGMGGSRDRKAKPSEAKDAGQDAQIRRADAADAKLERRR